MHSLHPELTHAMGAMLGTLDTLLRGGGYSGESVRIFAVGTRLTARSPTSIFLA